MSQQQTVLRVQSNIPGSLLPVYEFLDLYTDIPIKLNKSFAEIQDIGKKNTDYTIGLTIPGSKKNNRFFENFFNVDAQSLYFDATKRNNCDVLLGDEPLFRGYMRLNKVSVMNSKIQYDVTLYSTVSNLFGAIGNNLLRDLNYADSDYTFNHIFNLANVTQNFNYTNFSIDGEKPYPYLYPIVHNGYNYVSGSTVNQSGTTIDQTRIYTSTSPISGFTSAAAAWAAGVQQYQINSPTQGLINNQLKPAMNVWSILQLMFKTYGYTIKSDFFNTPWMKSLYLYGYFSSEATKFSYKINTIQEFAPEGVELITLVTGGNANVYVCKVGTGIPCYSLSDINITVITEYPYESIQYELPATIKAFTTGTTVNLGGDDYVETRTNSFATISAGPLKYLPQPVGTSIPYTDGLPVDFSQVIDINIKQIDLLGSIAKKFNLVFVSNPDNPIEIEIEPYDFYIGTGTIYDWSDKISYDRGWSVEPALNFVESQLTITDLEDSDEGNKQFKQRNNRVYGSNIVYNPTDFKSQEKNIETIFGAQLIRKWDDVNTNNIGLPLGINYVANNQPASGGSVVEWQYTGIKTKPKLMFWLGGFNPFLDIVGETYNQSNFPTYKVYVNNSDATTYFTSDKIPVISHTMPMGLSDAVKNSYNGNDSLCILFNSEQVTDIEGTIRTYNTYTENDAYNKFYNNRITNIYNPNTRFLSGFFNLKYNDVKLLKPNDIIKIQEQYFSWNRISDFNLTQREMTKVELVQLNVNPQEYPTRYFIYSYCNGGDCYKIKTDFTNPNLRDTNFGWSVYYDFQVGSLSGQTSGFTSTFVDIQGGFPKYVPYSMYEVTKEQYDSTICASSDCGDTLLTYIIDNGGLFSSANMPTFWVNSGTTITGINVFNNCTEFNSTASTYGILTGTSTNHGGSLCPTPTPTSSSTPTPTPTSTPMPTPTPTPPTPLPPFSGGTGFDIEPFAITTLSNNYSYISGWFTTYNGTGANNIIKLNTAGGIDTSFSYGSGFINTIDTEFTLNALLQSTGKLIVYGKFNRYNGTTVPNIVRLNTDGSLDTTFNSGGTGPTGQISGMAIDSSDKIIITNIEYYNGVLVNYICRLNSDGTLDTSFNSGGAGFGAGDVYKVQINSDGRYVVLTSSLPGTYNGTTYKFILTLNTNGTIYNYNTNASLFNSSANDQLVVQPDNKILISGNAVPAAGDQPGHYRLNSNLTIDSSFNNYNFAGDAFNSGNPLVHVRKVQSDGKILYCGSFGKYNGSAVSRRFIRLNSDGTLDTTFNSGGVGFTGTITEDVEILTDGSYLICGDFTAYNGTTARTITRINSNGTI